MRVVVFTRTWRVSPGIVLQYLLEKGINIEAVILEDRMEMVFAGAKNEGYIKKVCGIISRYGLAYVFEKLRETFSIRFHYLLRRYFSLWAGKKLYSAEEVALFYPLRICRVPSHNSPETLRLLEEIRPDVLVAVNARILKESVIARVGKAINLHLSALPRYGGMDSIFWALYHGEREIGVTVHMLERELDAGGIIEQEFIPVEKGDTEKKLYFKALDKGKELVCRALKKIESGSVETRKQEKVEYFGIPTKEERRRLKDIRRNLDIRPPQPAPFPRGEKEKDRRR